MIAAVLALALGPAAMAQVPAPSATADTDLTSHYLQAWNTNALSAAELAALRKHLVLVVAGFMSNYAPDSFAGVLAYLKSAGIDAQKVGINAEQSPDYNAKIIQAAIAASSKPVIMFTHSKGCLDTLHALMDRVDIQAKVKGWVAVQGPFFGSELADALVGGESLDPGLAKQMWSTIGGTPDSLKSLTTSDTLAYYGAHAAGVTSLNMAVPSVAFVSWTDSTDGPALLDTTRDYLLKMGLQNDGLVPVGSAVLPGMASVRVPHVYHSDPIVQNHSGLGGVYDNARFTKAILSALLARIAAVPPPLDLQAQTQAQPQAP